jgi:peptide chain release factor 2
MNDLRERIEILKRDCENLNLSYDLEEMSQRLKKLEAETTDPGFWNDQDNARRIMQEVGDIKNNIEGMRKLKDGLDTLNALIKEESLDESFREEIAGLEKIASDLRLKSFLSGEYDKKNAIISIHAGQGGVEAMDWASMLYRMYLKYIEKRGWKVEVIDYSEGEEAGIKSAAFKAMGEYCYGYLKGEAGTHRLVRQSPFNADNLRQTSFALVGVLPELKEEDLPDIKIKDEDLSWQFFRSSSQGGQNVQKVSTAVRVKHIPTGIIVTAQTQRFQEQNRKIALELLRAKLWLLAKEQEEKKVSEIKGEYRPASWGNQIRSYVLHPYKMVKDLRTGIETADCDSVLDGDIDDFVEAELSLRL